MRIYWFWPYIHAGELVLPAAVPRSGDHLVLHTMVNRITASDVGGLPIELAATLAAPRDAREGTPAWMASRATTYVQRVVQRRRALRDGKFDVCHVAFPNYFIDGFDFRSIARRTALVFEIHDLVPHETRLPPRVQHRLLSLLYSAPGRILVRHDVVRDDLVAGFGIDPGRITVVPLHVPIVSPIARDEPNASPMVLFFGTLRRNKGVAELLREFEKLTDLQRPSFVFAGRGFPDIEELVRDAAGRDARITFEHGYVSASRKHELYSAADVVVLPYTEFASASGVLRDAYAYHVPVVATDVGSLGVSVRSDVTGWVVPPSDAGALATTLADALGDRPAWQRASRNAGRIASERTPPRIGAMMRAVYDEEVGT